ncbi:MAG: trimethylamine methyltransferase family protein [Planctomycetota bacterium]|jgi:trimethylamine--corrinoid protein Co-methyltransferase
MNRITYGITGGLTREAIEKIRADVFALLESVGVGVESAEVLGELARHKGVRVEGEKVFYSPALVERFIEQVRAENTEYMLNQPAEEGKGATVPLIRPPFLCMRVWDLQKNAAVKATTDDLTRAARLLDSYGAAGVPPVHPQEVPNHLRQVATAKISYENSRGIGSFLQAESLREAEILCNMAAAAGRREPAVALQIVHSPLRLDANALDLILEMKRSDRTPEGVTAGGGAMPLAGAVSPLLAPGWFAQGYAEALAAYGTPKLLNEKIHGYCGMFPGTFDMRQAGISMATPEAILGWLAVRQLQEHFFGQAMGGDFACTGKTYDAQAAAEKTAAVLTAVLSGATTFANAGMTPTDEVFHFEGVVIDMEILGYAWRLRRGIGWEQTPTAEIVAEGERDGTFLMHPTTMRFRQEIWEPAIFTRESYDHWLAEGSPSVLERAAAEAERRIAENEYCPDADVRKELDRLMETARNELT